MSVDLLAQLVAIDSVFPGESELGRFLEMQLKQRGFTTRRQYISDDRFNVLAERGSRGRPFLFYGHMDTVPVYGAWSSSPLELRQDGDRLYGLGAYDMKAGIAAILEACSQETDRRIKVAFGVGEENNSEGSWAMVEDGFLSDVDAAIVPEINDSESGAQSPRAITLGRRGRAVYEFDVPGVSAHAADIRNGVNALTEAARLALELEGMNGRMPLHELLPRSSQFVSRIDGGSTSLSLPERASVVLDRHMVTPETPESVLGSLRAELDSLYSRGLFKEVRGKRITVRIKERETPYLAPYVTPQGNPYVQKLADTVRRHGEPIYAYGASVADENVLSMQGIPVMGIGPEGGNAHAADEWVSGDSLIGLSETLHAFVRML